MRVFVPKPLAVQAASHRSLAAHQPPPGTVNMAHENIIVAKGHKVNSPSVFFLFAGVFAAAATGGALGASTVGVYMTHSSRSKTGASIDYIAKALEYGKAVSGPWASK